MKPPVGVEEHGEGAAVGVLVPDHATSIGRFAMVAQI